MRGLNLHIYSSAAHGKHVRYSYQALRPAITPPSISQIGRLSKWLERLKVTLGNYRQHEAKANKLEIRYLYPTTEINTCTIVFFNSYWLEMPKFSL